MTLQDPLRPTLATLAQRVVDGDQRALARALSVVERHDDTASLLLARLMPHVSRAPIFGFTGSPGVGKSTLLDSCVASWRASGRSVAVVAVDPSSPVSGGAILGDRVRMHRHSADRGVFIRSVASRGSVGGLAESVFGVATTMLAGGWDVVVVETVGAGQSEIDIVDLADVTVVVTAPGLGDEIQALKAGILEIADVLVVNKADLPGAATAANHLHGAVALRAGLPVPIVLTSASTGGGVDEVVHALDAAYERGRESEARDRFRSRVVRVLARRCVRMLEAQLGRDPAVTAIAADLVLRGECTLSEASAGLLEAAVAGTAQPRDNSRVSAYRAATEET